MVSFIQEIISANNLVTVWYKRQFTAITCSVRTGTDGELNLDATRSARKRKRMVNPPLFQKNVSAQLQEQAQLQPVLAPGYLDSSHKHTAGVWEKQWKKKNPAI